MTSILSCEFCHLPISCVVWLILQYSQQKDCLLFLFKLLIHFNETSVTAGISKFQRISSNGTAQSKKLVWLLEQASLHLTVSYLNKNIQSPFINEIAVFGFFLLSNCEPHVPHTSQRDFEYCHCSMSKMIYTCLTLHQNQNRYTFRSIGPTAFS